MYEDRDIEKLEPYYTKHVSAMTGENLHLKMDIAAELAYRDKVIVELQQQNAMVSGSVIHRLKLGIPEDASILPDGVGGFRVFGTLKDLGL